MLLFPSLTETFGNVTLESLASGTPVLAFDSAAASEFINHGKNGWLVPVEDQHQFIDNAMTITDDKARLIDARNFTRPSVEHLGWNEIAVQVESIFQRAIDTA